MKLYTTFENCLPTYPYCTNDFTYGIKTRPAEIAKRYRLIQCNKKTDLKWIVLDVDRPTAHFDWQERAVPSPNFTVMNPKNGHCHYIYGLETPVYLQMEANQNPMRYAASVDIALTHKLEADLNYSKLIAKNPLHPYWTTTCWREKTYTLDELADYLDLSAYQDKRKRLPEIGLGRNCNLFDQTRFFAYREIRKPNQNYLFEEFYSLDDFIERCKLYAIHHNTFEVPLSVRECETIGLSVGKWVFKKMNREGFLEWSKRRRDKSIHVRKVKSEGRKQEALALKEQGYTPTQIATIMKISRMQVYRFIKN